jgi:hypothetical protein
MQQSKDAFTPSCSGRELTHRDRRCVLLAGFGMMMFGSLARAALASSGQPEPNRGDRTDMGEAARLAALCSGSNPIGVGLRGEYYSGENCRGEPEATRTDTTIEFASPHDLSKAAGMDRIGSVRWTGWIKPHVAGRFKFEGGSPQIRVSISNIRLSGLNVAPDAEIQLLAGRYYPIQMEINRIPPEQPPIRLRWTVPYGAHYLVPRQALFLPTDSVQTNKAE